MALSRVTDAIRKHSGVAVNAVLNAEFMLNTNTDMKSFGTRNRVLFWTSNVREWYSQCVVAPTLVAIEEFQDRDSGWTLKAVLNILVNINKHNPLRTGCDVPLPRAVVLNVYAWSDGSCAPLRLTEDKWEKHANLLLVQDSKDPQRYHFACIRSISRLISKQLGNHNGQVFVCER